MIANKKLIKNVLGINLLCSLIIGLIISCDRENIWSIQYWSRYCMSSKHLGQKLLLVKRVFSTFTYLIIHEQASNFACAFATLFSTWFRFFYVSFQLEFVPPFCFNPNLTFGLFFWGQVSSSTPLNRVTLIPIPNSAPVRNAWKNINFLKGLNIGYHCAILHFEDLSVRGFTYLYTDDVNLASQR